jgi:hypothetical protein
MTTPSKEEVQHFSPEQQRIFGLLEARRIRARQELVERARGNRSLVILAGLLLGAVGALAVYSLIKPQALMFSILALTGLITIHTAALNRRLDALMELLDHDHKPVMENEKSDSTRAA